MIAGSYPFHVLMDVKDDKMDPIYFRQQTIIDGNQKYSLRKRRILVRQNCIDELENLINILRQLFTS